MLDWYIGNLEVPLSIYRQGGQGPPPMLMERFQSAVIPAIPIRKT
jgi:hypothetical protein